MTVARGAAADPRRDDGSAYPAYTVTYLEMTARPSVPARAPEGSTLMRSETPPVWWFLALYDAVGSSYHWTDAHHRPRAEVEAFVQHPRTELWTLMRAGWPRGFFLLDGRAPPVCDLSYFGLVPEAVGTGIGRWFLSKAIDRAWSLRGTERVTVNTCTLDHPRALDTYRRAGFTVLRRQEHPGGVDRC